MREGNGSWEFQREFAPLLVGSVRSWYPWVMMQYDSLEKALGQLAKALTYANSHRDDAELFEQFRNSVIQTFEYSFELAFKLLKRTLASVSASDQEVEALSYNEVIRLGARLGFLTHPESWFEYRTARNKTSHGYEESFAQDGFLAAQEFLPAGRELLSRLRDHS